MLRRKSKLCEASCLTAPCGDAPMGENRRTIHAGKHLMIPNEKNHPAPPDSA